MSSDVANGQTIAPELRSRLAKHTQCHLKLDAEPACVLKDYYGMQWLYLYQELPRVQESDVIPEE